MTRYTYDSFRNLLLVMTFSDGTTPEQFTYNHLGQLTQVTDAPGTRTITYNRYGEAETDSLLAGSMTHTITEQRDTLGRSTGYTYAKNGIPQQQTTIGYGADGRVDTAGFTHQGEHKDFIYSYLPGTHLPHTLTHPNGLTLTQSYEPLRDLPTQMDYTRADALIVRRGYTYDILGRPTTRDLARYGTETQDTFGYNTRSELTTAHVNSADYTYAYDAIGNRAAAVENSSGVASRTEYRTNNLNQYTAEGTFIPTFDADGNQTLIKTSTGIWNVTYNAKNRPVFFTKSDGSVTVECTYDTMGRRATKKVTTNGILTEHRRFLYRGYLQIACCDLTRAYTPALWYILWDSTQPTATRPLAIQKNGTWYTYGWDLTKNICETYRTDGRIDLAYTYTPYGEVSPAHTYDQPLRWSSEYHDTELGLVYYNYRHYNPAMGRWLRRDDLQESQAGHNRFTYNLNNLFLVDKLGLYSEAGSMLLFSYYMVNPIPGRFLPGKEKRFENFEGKVVDIETLLPGISHELLDAIVHFHDIPEKVKNGINEEINKRVTARALIFNEFSGYDTFSDYTSNSYRFERVLFALGGGRVRTEYEVMYNWCSLHSGTNVAYEWNTHLNIYYSDVFMEPFYTEFSFIKIGIRNLEIGNPFGYVHQWTDHESIYMSDRGFITYSL